MNKNNKVKCTKEMFFGKEDEFDVYFDDEKIKFLLKDEVILRTMNGKYFFTRKGVKIFSLVAKGLVGKV